MQVHLLEGMIAINMNYIAIVIAAIGIAVGLAFFTYMMYGQNSETEEGDRMKNVPNIPDRYEQVDEWVKNTGSNSCHASSEQQFDKNASHYRCVVNLYGNIQQE